MSARLEWKEVRRTQWSQAAPPAPNGSCPPHTDYFTAVWKQATWPQDGSQYAGITYEDEMTWIGPEPGFAHTVVSHSQYPAPKPTDETGRLYERLAEQDRRERDRRDNADASADERAWRALTPPEGRQS